MKAKTFTFTAPDGTKLKRTSKTRTYTHAILHSIGGWRIASCVGRPELVAERPELVAERLETWGKGKPEVVAVEADKEAGR